MARKYLPWPPRGAQRTKTTQLKSPRLQGIRLPGISFRVTGNPKLALDLLLKKGTKK
jgi:hypothetical protein